MQNDQTPSGPAIELTFEGRALGSYTPDELRALNEKIARTLYVNRPDLTRIIDAVARRFNVPAALIRCGPKTDWLAAPRQFAATLIGERYPEMHAAEIAAIFSRDRSWVRYAKYSTQALESGDCGHSYRAEFDALRREIAADTETKS